MPQFDIVTFFNQLFYFIVVFFCFYFFIIGTVIPKISFVLKLRFKKLNNDTSSSNNLKKELILINTSFDKQFLNSSFNFIGNNNFCLNKLISLKLIWVNNFSKLNLKKKTSLNYLNNLIKLSIII